MSPSSPWRNGCSGAVSLTFDDGHPSQLRTVIPVLDQHGLQGTFYVNPRADDYVEWLKPWREAHASGHEIGNHTIRHVCSRNFGWNADAKGLEDLTLADIEADVLECSRRLREGVPEQSDFSFCYPCYQDFVGEGANRQSYVPVIARHFLAARAKGEAANHPRLADLASLWSFPCERMSGPELVGHAERAAGEGRWVILTFHGVGEGHLLVGESEFRELCGFLRRHRGRIWTAPVIQVAKSVDAWRRDTSSAL
ncbi:polysaccharide deacetylase [Candidatus Poribacteria bacterium]|nr:polysaccharide deacetylase [Candidatus Poribacteria bacterium]